MNCRARVVLGLLLLLGLAPSPSPAQGDGGSGNRPGPKTPQAQSAAEIRQAAQEQAVSRIIQAARGDNAELRMNAIEAMQPLPRRARPLAELGLNDDNPGVQFAALVTIGKLELDSLGEAAKKLTDADNPSVRAAALFAAKQCGLEVDISPLARLAGSQDPTVRGNAVMLLGLMGDQSAIGMLEAVGKSPMPRANAAREAVVRIQIAEALVRLGQEQALEPLRAAVYSRHLEARALAVTVLGRLGDRKLAAAMEPMLEKPPIELQLAAAKTLARLGQSAGHDVLMQGASMTGEQVRRRAQRFLDEPQRMQVNARFKQLLKDKSLRESIAANLRAQAVFGLAYLDRPKAARKLVSLMTNDPAPRVQLAAAAATLEAVADGEAAAEAHSQPGRPSGG
jgi:HEAT repeat protein